MSDKLLRNNGQNIDAMFSIKMPDTWTPMFDLYNKEQVKAQNDSAKIELVKLIDQIKNRVTGNHMRHKLPMFAAKTFYKTYGYQSKTSHFVLEESCNGCSLCAKKCPANALK